LVVEAEYSSLDVREGGGRRAMQGEKFGVD
jgi:hypothetical protein